MRRNSKRGLIATAVVLVAVLLGVFLKLYQDTAPAKSAEPTHTPSATASSSQSGRAPTGTARAGTAAAGGYGAETGFPKELTSRVGTRKAGPRHTVTLIVTSAGAIAQVGWLVPTSDDTPYGKAGGPSSPWRKTMTAYGTSYLAGVFVQAGRTGLPVTCRILIDGVTRNVRTTSGSYARQLCIA